MICHWEEGRGKFGNGLCNGCNGCQEEGRGKREEGRRKRQEGRKISPFRVLCTKPAQCIVSTAQNLINYS
ncbi:hypothetical protein NDI47_24250 [Microcoleus vaginatus GB1-A2]|uniref:hypothetical protein n=1 Tax=Microcoleus vaginatus TaxID=119532 RepID=UPI001681E84E|nr:hypothetical protein [Microcoleus sp. FACHB-61]